VSGYLGNLARRGAGLTPEISPRRRQALPLPATPREGGEAGGELALRPPEESTPAAAKVRGGKEARDGKDLQVSGSPRIAPAPMAPMAASMPEAAVLAPATPAAIVEPVSLPATLLERSALREPRGAERSPVGEPGPAASGAPLAAARAAAARGDAAPASAASLEPRSRGEAERPLPRTSAAVVVPPEPRPSEEPRIEVRIGRIELRTAPPQAPVPAPPARRGFEEFAAKRRYQDRKWY
jgi:hypothetical protein